jgi:GH15 family glucan-1,4-alpha-glucosidase
MSAPLEHYGLISDASSIALVSRSGSIDWFCAPRIDSNACFAQLLGTNDNGYWSMRPAASVRSVDQHYRKDTLILETEITCDGGRARVIDFMPRGLALHDIVRIVEGIEGEVPMHCDLSVRFGYGKLDPWIKLSTEPTPR